MKDLIAKYPAITLEVNFHRTTPETLEHYIENMKLLANDLVEVPEDVQKEMIRRDSIVELYVHTSSVGEYYFAHYDYDTVIELAKKELL